jgi:pimeloyl-ACP methyl ester carboxylesterase
MSALTGVEPHNSKETTVNPINVLRRALKYAATLGAAACVATLALTACSAPSAQTGNPPSAHIVSADKPTIVLVHGAFTDASEWDGVIKRLQAAGYPVVTPPNPLRGMAGDSQYLHSFLASVKGPIILVGHSIGGFVTTEAAVGDPQVKALVYIAALMPDVGETATELVNKYPGATLGDHLQTVPFSLPGGGTDADLYVRPDKFHEVYAADVPEPVTEVMAAAQRPVAASMFNEKCTEAAWKTIPSWDLITTQDAATTLAVQHFMATRAHAHATEVSSSHAVAISHPDEVTSVIEQAAQATVH